MEKLLSLGSLFAPATQERDPLAELASRMGAPIARLQPTAPAAAIPPPPVPPPEALPAAPSSTAPAPGGQESALGGAWRALGGTLDVGRAGAGLPPAGAASGAPGPSSPDEAFFAAAREALLPPGLTAPPQLPPAPLPSPRRAFTGKGGTPTTADYIGELQAANADEAAAADYAAAVNEQKAKQLSAGRFDVLQREQRASELLGQAYQDAHQHADDRMSKITAEVERLSQEKPDPKRYFKNQSTLGNIAQLIGVALGGYSAAKTGKNVALDFIEREIERDVDAQAREYQQKLAALQERRGVAKDELANRLSFLEFKTTRLVDATKRAMQMVDVAAEHWAATPASEAQKAQLKAGLRQNAAQEIEAARGRSFAEGMDKARVGIAGGQLALGRRQQEHQEKMDAANFAVGVQKWTGEMVEKELAQGRALQGAMASAQKERDALTFVSPSTGQPVGLAYDADSLHNAQKFSRAMTTSMKAFEEYRDAIVKYGQQRLAGPALGAAAQELKAKHANVFRAMRDFSASGANLSDAEIENIIKPMAPAPQGVLDFTKPLPAIDAAIDTITSQYNTGMAPYFRVYRPAAPPEFNSLGGRRGNAAPTPVEARKHWLPRRGEGATAVRPEGSLFGGIPEYGGIGPVDYLEHGARGVTDALADLASSLWESR